MNGLYLKSWLFKMEFRQCDPLQRCPVDQSGISMNQLENFWLRRVSLTCDLRVGVDAARFSIHQLVRIPVTSPFLSLSFSQTKGEWSAWRSDREKDKERKKREKAGFSGFPPPQPRVVSPIVLSRYLRTMRCVHVFTWLSE